MTDSLQASSPFGESREVTGEQHAKGDASVKGGERKAPHGFASRSRVLSRIASLINGELADRLVDCKTVGFFPQNQ